MINEYSLNDLPEITKNNLEIFTYQDDEGYIDYIVYNNIIRILNLSDNNEKLLDNFMNYVYNQNYITLKIEIDISHKSIDEIILLKLGFFSNFITNVNGKYNIYTSINPNYFNIIKNSNISNKDKLIKIYEDELIGRKDYLLKIASDIKYYEKKMSEDQEFNIFIEDKNINEEIYNSKNNQRLLAMC